MQPNIYKKIHIVACATQNNYAIFSVEVIIMQFCDKLANLRKKNNITQEQLADKLNVSRQAVSKWENGTSIPDIKKIMEISKVLSCDLSELIDVNTNLKKEEKFNLLNYFKDILDFITRTYNMFCSMKFYEKIKCLLELLFISLTCFLIFFIIANLISMFINPILNNLPNNIYWFIRNTLLSIYNFVAIIISFVIVIHLFKIRYLDYFVTVFDDNIDKKVIEEAIPENKSNILKEDKKRIIVENKKEKIIIRDPKHTSYSFFNALLKIIIYLFKGIAITIGGFGIISFICLAFFFFVFLFYLFQSVTFLGIVIILISLLILNYLVLNVLYNFVFNIKMTKKIFYTLIGILISFSLGLGLTFLFLNNFEYIDELELIDNVIVETYYIDNLNNTKLTFIDHHFVELIQDETIKDIKIDIYSVKNNKVVLKNSHHNGIDNFYLIWTSNGLDSFNMFIDMLKSEQFYNFDDVKVKIYVNEENMKLLKKNYNLSQND